ncbi:MAG TPA: PilZ domain-containing protein [Solirubrobacteraceae bacterium]|nr:PilZ domain-containing protein [Solirubrobacteraceae bacterium]
MSLRCTLTRSAGRPIAARTLDVGTTGMRVVTERPLAVDETIAFDLPCGDVRISGELRVVCQERPDVYTVRFSRLPQPMARCLHDVVSRQPSAS